MLRQKMDSADYQHIFRFWEHLSLEEKDLLASQLKSIDWDILKKQKYLLKKHPQDSLNVTNSQNYQPFLDFNYAQNLAENQKKGLEMISKGLVGCLVLAGGQGSRLKTKDPKGMYPVSIIKHKSLFQLIAEKVGAASRQAGRPLPMAIMTSPLNDEATRQLFAENAYFGLEKSQVFFFSQKMLPFLDKEGRLFLENTHSIASGPDGNGNCFKEFIRSGIYATWKAAGVQYIHVQPIDNPLADPFDSELLHYHHSKKADLVVKAVEKIAPDEKVGVLIKEGHSIRVVEYSEMSQREKEALLSDGRLKHRCANISLFSLTMDFISTLANREMPLHLAWKATPYVDDKGITQEAKEPNAWKFETFIFDVLAYTDQAAALLYPRSQCFAPLKNATGTNSLSAVQEALQNRDREIFEHITGKKAPSTPFELSQDFYYPTPQLLIQWKGKTSPGGYIDAYSRM